jgi:hypothetical protein
MENLPKPDFVCSFYNGIRITISGSTRLYTIKINPDLTSQYPLNSKETKADGTMVCCLKESNIHSEPSLHDIFAHVEICCRRCTEINEKCSLDPSAKYPMIFKANQSPTRGNSRPLSPATSLQPSINTFSTSRGISNRDQRINRGASISSKMPLFTSKSRTYLNSTKDSQNQRIEAISSCSGLSTAKLFTPKYLSKIGWCVQTPDKRFAMLFDDGIQLNVDPKTHSLEYINGDSTL